MDLVLYLLPFLMGMIVHRILFGGKKSGPFEESIMSNLAQGKRVVLSIEDDCYIFEMYGDKMRITQGISTFEETPYDLDSVSDNQSDSNNENVL